MMLSHSSPQAGRSDAARAMRRGVTLTEMMIVLVLLGILAAIAFPGFARGSERSNVRTSKQRIASYLAVTRAAAIQRGRVARFVRTGNTIKVLVDSANTQGVFAPVIDLAEQGVTFTPTRDTISFDPRGLAFGFTGTAHLVVQKGSSRDSVCVMGMGRISTAGCS
jgi:prepilin-type N-terminal cleavage/methylation domain-containing protein